MEYKQQQGKETTMNLNNFFSTYIEAEIALKKKIQICHIQFQTQTGYGSKVQYQKQYNFDITTGIELLQIEAIDYNRLNPNLSLGSQKFLSENIFKIIDNIKQNEQDLFDFERDLTLLYQPFKEYCKRFSNISLEKEIQFKPTPIKVEKPTEYKQIDLRNTTLQGIVEVEKNSFEYTKYFFLLFFLTILICMFYRAQFFDERFVNVNNFNREPGYEGNQNIGNNQNSPEYINAQYVRNSKISIITKV
ncbi:hypothetical protein IMG5_088870 [Ichthyophthirius multifiliis]|uniref:Transmembrane protein n=1 Tax=Ichthyophthirius multifiliis TaxID=5932 RepID=G0QR51_ICHMU|nr:hypothetical protein IMG5_088870 [Ichthyophthirius multifiliis]EGR32303.1 hypothetical protein IMG5_088870 [Ichthyophthirius multifiliis]|eukprot:XP_004035789.1 hypothetical protein IMG5_088870 [Ichthyophthirius multifiliis]